MLASTIVEVTPHALKRYRMRFNAQRLSYAKALHNITQIVLSSRKRSKHTCKKLQQVWQGSTNVTKAAKKGHLWWNPDRKCVVVGSFVKPKLFLCRTIIVPDFDGGKVAKARSVVAASKPMFSYRRLTPSGVPDRRVSTIYRVPDEHVHVFGNQYPFLRVDGIDTKNPVPLTAADAASVLAGVLQHLGELAATLSNEAVTSQSQN